MRGRDLTRVEFDALESMIDSAGLDSVLQGLSEVCGLKAEHIAGNWQDSELSRQWATAEGLIAITSLDASIRAVS